MSFVTSGASSARGGGKRTVAARPTLNAHFARQERLLEDQRHASMLRGISNRPASARPGAFAALADHDFYARTLALRKRSERSEREFARQKDNLLLLQRLQQIEFHQHPSRTQIGRNYVKDWEEHQRKHDAGLARLRVRPRLGSSLVFRSVDRVSPLTPRNRAQWDGRALQTKLQPYRDTTWERDPDRHTFRPATAAAVPPSKVAQQRDEEVRRAMEAERDAIEAELQRRWDDFDFDPAAADNARSHPANARSRQAVPLEVQLPPDEEEKAWSRALDPFVVPAAHVAPLLVAYSAAAASGTGPIDSSRPSDDLQALAAMESARRRAIRARYVAEDEEDVDLGEEEEEEKQQHADPASSGTRATPSFHHHPAWGAPVPLESLYALAMHPQLSAGDAELEAYRGFQYAQLHGLPPPGPSPQPLPHAPRPPLHRRSGSRSARSTRRPTSASSNAAASAAISPSSGGTAAAAAAVTMGGPPPGAYDSADAHWHASHPSIGGQWHNGPDPTTGEPQDSEIESLLDALNDQDQEAFDAHPQHRRSSSRPASALRRPEQPTSSSSPRGGRGAVHARSSSVSSLQRQQQQQQGTASTPRAPTAARRGGHARTVSLAVGPSSSRTHAHAHARHHSALLYPHPPPPQPSTLPPGAAAAAARHEQELRAQSEREAEAEAERYFASLGEEYPSRAR